MIKNFDKFTTVKVQRKSKNIIDTNKTKRVVKSNFTTLFCDNKFYVEYNDKKYEILINIEDYFKVNHLYTTPLNDFYPKWTLKITEISSKTSNMDVTIKYWSPIKDNQKIKGFIKDDLFIPDWEFINKSNLQEYQKILKRISHASKKDR